MNHFTKIILITLLICTCLIIPTTKVEAATSDWVGSNSYGLIANHSAALAEVKNLMQQQTSTYKISRFELILSEFPLSGYFNASKTSPCDWHCGKCKETENSCIYSFYDSEIKDSVPLYATQCYGYARYCSYRFFGSILKDQGQAISSSNVSSVDNFKAYLNSFNDLTGAHFRVSGHSLVYLARTNDYIYFIDANSGYNSATGASKQCSTNSTHYSTCCKINLRKMTYSQFLNKYSNIVLYHIDTALETPTVTHGYSGTNDTITDTNAFVFGTVSKPSTYIAEKFGIRIRKTNSTYENGWSLYHAASSSYVGTTKIKIFFDMNEELNLTLTHATSYTYQLYTKINGIEYWSEEKNFTTTGTHTYGAWSETQSANCTTAGDKIRFCICGFSETVIIPALGHNYSSTWTIDSNATCITAGSKSNHCVRCSAQTNITTIPATGHIFGNWNITQNTSCTSTGSKSRFCFCGASETESIPAAGHNYSTNFTIDKKASCTNSGTKSYHCTQCTAQNNITVIPATGHSWSDWITECEPTVNQSGSKSRTCNACNAKENITLPPVASDMHTHKYGDWKTVFEPTCQNTGESRRKCTQCDATEVMTLAATSHIFSEWRIIEEATLQTMGKMERVCNNCTTKEELTYSMQNSEAPSNSQPPIQNNNIGETAEPERNSKHPEKKLIIIVVAAIAVLLLIIVTTAIFVIYKKKHQR